MLALGLDTATEATTTALVEVAPDRLVPRGERTATDPRAHGELLAPQIAALLAAAGVAPEQLAAVVAGTGPGPFTGLRVGLATAAALGQALAVPTYPVCSLDALAAEVLGPAMTAGFAQLSPLAAGAGPVAGRLLVATDARRREVYWAGYQGGRRVAGPAVDRPAVLAGRLAELGVSAAVGEGAHRYRDELGGVPLLEAPRHPSAYQLVALAADRIRAGAPGEPLVPRYLRRPDTAAPHPPKQVLPG